MNNHEIAYREAKELLADILADCVMMSDLAYFRDKVKEMYIDALSDLEYHLSDVGYYDPIKIETYRLVWRWLDDMYEGRRYPGIEGV